MEAINQIRGRRDRSELLRDIIHQGLIRHGADVQAYKDPRGLWNRLDKDGILSPANARARREELLRGAHKLLRFTDAGIVGHPELDSLGMEAGYLNELGVYEPTTQRFSLEQIREGLQHVMANDPDRVWPARYKLFMQSSQ